MKTQLSTFGNSLVLWAGAIVLLITALFSSGFHHWDEHYQVLEFAGHYLGNTPHADLPWEFDARIRPSLQPWMVVVLYRFFELFTDPDPFMIATVLRLVSAVLSFVAILCLVGAFKPTIKSVQYQYWFVLLSFFIWFAVYDAVRFSSENWSGALFMIGFASLVNKTDRSTAGKYFLVGLLFGAALVIRLHAAIMITGFMAWLLLIKKVRISDLLLLSIGVLSNFCVGILLDKLFYGEWTLTAWNYFVVNVLEGKANSFSIDPWYTYIVELVTQTLPPFSILFIVAPLYVLIRDKRDPLVWVVVPFFVIHSIIGHKELRFLFPLVGILPITIMRALEVFEEQRSIDLNNYKAWRIATHIFWIANLILVAVIMFKPAAPQVPLFSAIYSASKAPTKLYYFEEDPFDLVEPVHFYRSPKLTIAGPIADSTLFNGEPVLIATTHRSDVEDRWATHELVFSSFPEWLERFDFNGWVGRTDKWFVYKVQPN